MPVALFFLINKLWQRIGEYNNKDIKLPKYFKKTWLFYYYHRSNKNKPNGTLDIPNYVIIK